MKYPVAIAALLACCPSFGCEISYSAGHEVIPVIQKYGFHFEGYDDVCKKLKAAGAILEVHATTFRDESGRTLGFADVFVSATDESAMADNYRTGYAESEDSPSKAVEEEVMNNAITAALSGIDDEIDGDLTTINIHQRLLHLAEAYIRAAGKKTK